MAAKLMPQIQCNGSGNPACFLAAAGANHYRFVGLEIAEPATVSNTGNGLVDLSAGARTTSFLTGYSFTVRL